MTTTIDPWAERVDGGDWEPYHRGAQRARGALLPRLVTPEEAARIAGLYEQDEHFRSTVNMGRHRFGEGEYRYFARPFPEPIEQLRQALYPHLLPIARDWWDKLGRPAPGTTMTMATDPAGPQRAAPKARVGGFLPASYARG